MIRQTRPAADGLRRRRHCVCGHRYNTLEVVISDTPRRLQGMSLTTLDLDKKKLIAAVARALDDVV